MDKTTYTIFHFDEETESYTPLPVEVGHALIRQGEIFRANGENQNISCTLRVFTNRFLKVCAGDYVMSGKVSELNRDIAFSVKCVTDNRQGSQRMRHWRIDCIRGTGG